MFGTTGRAMRHMAHAAVLTAAAVILVLTSTSFSEAQTRTLKLYHVHLKERVEITYKRGGRFLPEGLKQANWALRDWRESKPTQMDPHLLDMLWEIQNRSGTRDYINIIGGYRSPATNRALRSRSSGVADNSLHTQGKAIDFFIPDVPLSRVRAIALQLQSGGVGYYPRSGSPFVHIDTGNGRYWPRMNRNQLAQIFPNGNTVYLPADGKPLPGYQSALASFNQRRGSASVQMADARSGGPTLLARLFGGGAEEAEDNAEAEAAPARRPAAAPARPSPRAPEPSVQIAAAQPSRPAALPAGVAMPDRETFDTSSRTPTPRAGIPQEQEVAALSLARVPVPTSSPARTAPAAAPSEEPAAQSSLVAALEARTPAIASELAYAVPRPSQRPPFEAVLEAGASIPVPLAASGEREVAALTTEQPADEAPTSIAEILTAARAEDVAERDSADAAPAAVDVAVMEVEEEPTLVAALDPAGAAALLTPAVSAAPTPAESAAAAGSSGKSGRVLREGSARPSATPVAAQQAIASRIEIAALVTSPERRAQEARAARPKADMLVVDVPVSVLATGFAPKQPVGASDRFSGSAVTFLPVRRLD